MARKRRLIGVSLQAIQSFGRLSSVLFAMQTTSTAEIFIAAPRRKMKPALPLKLSPGGHVPPSRPPLLSLIRVSSEVMLHTLY